MPMHDWTLVPDGIFHALHHAWVSQLSDVLNANLLPPDLYAIIERNDSVERAGSPDVELYGRMASRIAVRHVSGDDIVALVEIVSPGNKASDYPLNALVRKVREFIEAGVHQLILDPFAPGPRDPNGVHALVWEPFAREPFRLPDDARLTFVSYEAADRPRAYIEPTNVGAPLPNMPLFVTPGAHVLVPLEDTYQSAFEAQPRRWRNVLAPPGAK